MSQRMTGWDWAFILGAVAVLLIIFAPVLLDWR